MRQCGKRPRSSSNKGCFWSNEQASLIQTFLHTDRASADKCEGLLVSFLQSSGVGGPCEGNEWEGAFTKEKGMNLSSLLTALKKNDRKPGFDVWLSVHSQKGEKEYLRTYGFCFYKNNKMSLGEHYFIGKKIYLSTTASYISQLCVSWLKRTNFSNICCSFLWARSGQGNSSVYEQL